MVYLFQNSYMNRCQTSRPRVQVTIFYGDPRYWGCDLESYLEGKTRAFIHVTHRTFAPKFSCSRATPPGPMSLARPE